MKKSNKKGLPLALEIVGVTVLVLVLLGLIIAIAVPDFDGYTQADNENKCAANIKIIESAYTKALIDDVVIEDNTTVNSESGLGAYITDIDNLKCPSNKHNYIIDKNGSVWCATHKPKK